MTAIERGTDAGMNATAGSLRPAVSGDAFSCEWDRDLVAVGLQTGLPPALRIGISAFALAMLAGAILAAFLGADAGGDPGLIGLALVLAAAAPWARWAVLSDNGPSWPFAAFVVIPVAVLGIGGWTDGPIGLNSDTAYYLATIPILPLTLLYAGFAPPRMAVGVLAAAFIAIWAPLLAGWMWGEENRVLTPALVWSAGFALCVAAGWAVRLSYVVNRSLTEAREALAWQAAADQRRRIAQDVHDVVAHTLAITMLHITAARMAVRRSSPAEAEEALEEAERHGRASLNDIRRIVRLLRSEDATAVDAAQPGLADIEALTESYRAAGLPVQLSMTVDGSRHASPTAELALYRVLQESLANAARHGAGPATVNLQVIDGAMSLNVANPVQREAVRSSQGSGLLGMRERITAAGGTIEAGAQNGRWVVRATVPRDGLATLSAGARA